MESIFITLYSSLSQGFLISLLASFGWGLASVLLSPCHLTSIPLIISTMLKQKNLKWSTAFIWSFWFSIGILLSMLILGFVTGMLGMILGDLPYWMNWIFAIVFILTGLIIMDVISLGSINLPVWINFEKITVFKVLGIGFIFGFILGPCSFAFMAPVLSIALVSFKENWIFASLLILTYSIGHCAVITFAGASIGTVKKLIKWNDKSHGLIIFKKICGALISLAGLYLIIKMYI